MKKIIFLTLCLICLPSLLDAKCCSKYSSDDVMYESDYMEQENGDGYRYEGSMRR